MRHGATAIQVLVADTGSWATVRDVRLRGLRDAPGAFCSTLAEEEQQPEAFWRGRLLDGGTTLLAMPDGGEQAVGIAVITPADDTATGCLVGVWVDPSARGRGVGDALLSTASGHARTSGLRRLVLDVGDRNDRAIALYDRHGFRATGRRGTLPAPREHVTEHELALDLV